MKKLPKDASLTTLLTILFHRHYGFQPDPVSTTMIYARSVGWSVYRSVGTLFGPSVGPSVDSSLASSVTQSVVLSLFGLLRAAYHIWMCIWPCFKFCRYEIKFVWSPVEFSFNG